MKENTKLIKTLNGLLSDELTAINQYMVHSEMCGCWGYEKLHKHFESRAIQEMKHAESLIGRILSMGGTPVVGQLGKVTIGSDIPKQLAADRAAEEGAVKAYNDAIKLACDTGDNATCDFLVKILNDEEEHLGKIGEMLDQIEQMTLPIFLTTQI